MIVCGPYKIKQDTFYFIPDSSLQEFLPTHFNPTSKKLKRTKEVKFKVNSTATFRLLSYSFKL